jgi:hypothetical protein
VPDAEKLTDWLADHVCCKERRVERVREALPAQLRAEKIDPPAKVRLARVIGSALRMSEATLVARISVRILAPVTVRMGALIAEASDEPDVEEEQAQAETEPGDGPADGEADRDGGLGPDVWAAIKSDPGNVSRGARSLGRKSNGPTRDLR